MPDDLALAEIPTPDGPVLDNYGDAVRIILPGEETAIRRALKQMRACLSQLALNTEEMGTFEIVVAEALNNIVEHAYADCTGVIEIALTRQTDGLKIVITDSGVAMPDGQVPLGELVEYPEDPEELPEGGFGWFLIHDLTHELTYARVDDRNVLRFRLAMGLEEG